MSPDANSVNKMDIQTHFNEKLDEVLQEKPGIKRLLLTLSGGIDSCVLLFLCSAYLNREINASDADLPSVSVLHVNHNLQADSGNWAKFCERLAQSYHFDFVEEPVFVDGTTQLEEKARKLRYQCFEKHSNSETLVLTAHHLNDQFETLLFRLFRGAGADGLSGMPEMRDLGSSFIFRPMLDIPRSDIESFAKDKSLTWVEDNSNLDTRFSRNLIRQKIIPEIQKKWPTAIFSIQRASTLLKEQNQLLLELAQEDYSKVLASDSQLLRWGTCLQMQHLRDLSLSRQKNLLRFILKQEKLAMPSEKRLNSLLGFYLQNRESSGELCWIDADKVREVQWHVFENHLFFDVCVKSQMKVPDQEKLWQVDAELSWGRFVYKKQNQAEVGISPEISQLKVCARQGGERCQPEERQHSQLLKKLLLEYRVPPWLRDEIPILKADGKIVAVGDLFVCQGYSSDKPAAWRLSMERV